jgi:lipopolysaccharide transport system ATP-binding protein
MAEVIATRQLGKKFKRYHIDQPHSWKEWVLCGFRRKRPVDSFWALRSIDLSVAQGRMLGVIGINGSGKSTLLQVLGGAFPPDEGHIWVRGRIGALIGLGTGFHRDLSGRENVYIYGVIAGLTRSEIRARFDSIVAFAELEDFIDSPYRTYSTGMQMRLAFSSAIHTEPEVMLIDEVLTVGDLAFQTKCLERVIQLKESGCTMVIVSHDLDTVKRLCDEVLWVHSGRMAAWGDPETVVQDYSKLMSRETQRRMPKDVPVRLTPTGFELRSNENRFGSFEVEILDLRISDLQGRPINELEGGDSLCIEIQYLAAKSVDSPIFGVTLSNEERSDFLEVSTDVSGFRLPPLTGKGSVRLIIDRLDLKSGKYFINPGIYKKDWEYAYDYHWHVYPIIIDSKMRSRGIITPPHRWLWG